MHYNFYLSPLMVSLALATASPTKAATPLFLKKESLEKIKQTFQIAIPSEKKLTTTSINSLQVLNQHIDKNHITHLRLQQYYAGFPVMGGYAIIHSPQSASVLLHNPANTNMNGIIYHGLQEELGQPPADLTSQAKIALQKFKEKYKNKSIQEEKIDPIVYIDEQHQAHWAYKVSLVIIHTDKIPEKPTAILDAISFKIFQQWNDIKTVRVPAKGMGFGGNEKVGEIAYGKNYPLLDIQYDKAKATCFMENKDVRVIDLEHKYSYKLRPMEFDCPTAIDEASLSFWTGYQGDGYDQENGAFSPSNDALFVGKVIKNVYHDWYGVDALKRPNGSPMKLIMRVHYGEGYSNAFWDGEQMTFGDGDPIFYYPFVSLGVGGHEVSHGFTEQHSGLEYFGQSGGMNESFSDMAAQAVEYYATGKNDWRIGAEIIKEGVNWKALRYMDKPSRDGRSIDRADQYHPKLDVHYSSGVYNHLFYILANQPDWNLRKAFDVMVKANMDYWLPNSTFEEGGCGILSAAKDLNFPLEAVKASLEEVAIKYENCE